MLCETDTFWIPAAPLVCCTFLALQRKRRGERGSVAGFVGSNISLTFAPKEQISSAYKDPPVYKTYRTIQPLNYKISQVQPKFDVIFGKQVQTTKHFRILAASQVLHQRNE